MSRNFKNLINELETIKKQLNEDFIFGNGEEGILCLEISFSIQNGGMIWRKKQTKTSLSIRR